MDIVCRELSRVQKELTAPRAKAVELEVGDSAIC